MAAAERLYTVVFIFTGANETENNHTPPFFRGAYSRSVRGGAAAAIPIPGPTCLGFRV